MLESVQMSQDFYSQLSRELVVHLRGDLTQSELNEKLGYSFNQVSKWESGTTLFHWHDFVELCNVLNVEWKRHFQEVFIFHEDVDLDNTPLFEILRSFYGLNQVSDLAKILNKSRSSLSRLIHDQVRVDFADALRLIDIRPLVLTSWISKFANPLTIPVLKDKYQNELQIFQGLLSIPWAPMVNACLSLKPYHDLEVHDDNWVGEKTGLSAEQVRTALGHLLSHQLIEFRNQKYVALIKEMTFLKVPEFRRVTHFLTENIAHAFNPKNSLKPNLNNPSLTLSRINPVSSQASKKIADAIVAFHHQVTEILKKDQGPKDHVRAILMHSLDLELLSQVAKSDGP